MLDKIIDLAINWMDDVIDIREFRNEISRLIDNSTDSDLMSLCSELYILDKNRRRK